MAFQTPITIRTALERVQQREYVLPMIQRDFVWKPPQICQLFDSLMKGYPIGTFLFWRVKRENTAKFRFHQFVKDYHQRDTPRVPTPTATGDHDVTAVLDGQQRLTALNVGLFGSHATAPAGGKSDCPDDFPRKQLHLNLMADAPAGEEGLTFDFQFMTEAKAVAGRDGGHFWFPVGKVMQMAQWGDLYQYLQTNGLLATANAGDYVNKLHELVNQRPLINFYLEEVQDLDRVLNIFRRVNSGGTKLGHSDLLLSIATARWQDRDAQAEIHGLVGKLNQTPDGFRFGKDFVLKAGLMMAGIEVGFKVTNFTDANMHTLAGVWDNVAEALRLTVRLVADFGFTPKTLGADSALLPIAYYLYHRQPGTKFLTRKSHANDRDAIRRWLIRALLKTGVWGSGLDTTLMAIRGAIKEHGGAAFPVEAIEGVMAPTGRSLMFGEAEIQALADLPYRDPRTFAVLSLLFPFVDLRNKFHIDHMFPKSRFTPTRLARAGVAAADAKVFRDQCERLANLQLLEGVFNVPKSATLPADWLSGQFPDPVGRQAYTDRHDLGDVPAAITDFGAFYAARRARLVARLRRTLGVVEPTPAGSGDGVLTPAALLGELNAHLGTTWTEQEVPGLPPAPGWSAARKVLEEWAAQSKTTLGQWSEPARRALERWWAERKRGGA